MVGIGSGDFEDVAISVDVHVLGLGYSRLQPVFGAQARHATPRIELVPVNRVDLFPSEEDGFLFQGENRRLGLLGKAPKQSRMQRAGLPMGFLELLIGGGADTGGLSVPARFIAFRLGTGRRLRNGLGVAGHFPFHGPTSLPILPEPETRHRGAVVRPQRAARGA